MLGRQQRHMGLVLLPDDADTSSPDVSWSYSGFAAFRRRLAEKEGFALSEMWGFGGERSWREMSTALEPILDHPDDGGDDKDQDNEGGRTDQVLHERCPSKPERAHS
ncbi:MULTISPECIES: hypothetical protein [unclassified Streptomyces]|uniref:hypothetical protein n=1 Tax=unclassified Streptomyces TaxID=2593676 RepID=UPI0031FD1E11